MCRIAALEGELRDWSRRHCEPRISTRCPSCGHDTLFIAKGGHLTCSWLECGSPGLARYSRLEAKHDADLARLRALEGEKRDLGAQLYAATERVQHLLTTIDVERTGRKEAEEEVVRLTTQADTLARLAKEATNGWACFARRKAEFDGIAKLHDDIDAALHAQDTEVGR